MKYSFKTFEDSSILRNHLNLGGSNPSGERIDVTSRYLERGGKPWIPIMGEIHFSRVAREDWQKEICKMKAGGITLVATYLFWIYHEEIEGEMDFSGDNDIRQFVLECKKAGMEVVLRIGPWAHGECRNGGFPDWLLKKDYRLRDNNDGYLAQVRRWYGAIAKEVEGLYYKDGGNIVAIQLENEYCHSAEHLAMLKVIAKELGMEVPIYTVTGWNSSAGAKIPVDEVIPVFGGYCDAPWDSSLKQLPPSVHYFFNRMRNDSAIGADLIPKKNDGDWQLPYERYPFATCELGGGMQVTHHRRPFVKAMDTYALALVKLGDGNNLPGYYMYHGCTHKIGKLSTFQESKATGYPNDYSIRSYDFQAPISEFGEIRESYGLLNILHLFLQDFAESFAPLVAVDSSEQVDRNDTTSLRYGMRTDGEKGYVFVNHYQRLSKLADVKDVVIDTGSVVFPKIDVCGDVSFFMPFNMEWKSLKLKYATAQPICTYGDTIFFMAIPGIEARYCVEVCDDSKLQCGNMTVVGDGKEYIVETGLDSAIDINGVKIITLSMEQAKHLRKLDGYIYVGDGCDLYMCEDELFAVQNGEFDYYKYNGEVFEKFRTGVTKKEAEVIVEAVKEAPFVPTYAEQLEFNGKRELTWKRLKVDVPEGFVTIADTYDVAQIYADGKLVADSFYYGDKWRVPAKLMHGKESYLVMSEMKDDFYREF